MDKDSTDPKADKTKKENKTMFKKNKDIRKQEPKQPMKVEVRVALPWTLLLFFAAILASHFNGWNMRSEDAGRVTAEAHSIVELSKAQSKQ